jgi:uncharacterized membrane protein YphA (DoxX/SURF4 family)
MANGSSHLLLSARDGVHLSSPFVLASLFLFAAAAKIYYMADFKHVTGTFSHVPLPLRALLPLVVPLVEILVGCLILMPPTRRLGLYLCVCTLAVFSVFLAVQVSDPFAPACHCFGTLELARDAKASNRLGLWRNFVLLGLAYIALRPSPKRLAMRQDQCGR